MDELDDAARALREADAAAALTGAGVSVPSGIPPFRGENGVWNEYDPDAFDVRRLRAEPGPFWEDWLELRADLLDADVAPNAAHDALASLARSGHLDAVITQNIDGLHGDADTGDVVELHGNGTRASCRRCDRTVPAEAVRNRAQDGELPPLCSECGGVLEPDAVLFGERLPVAELSRAEDLAEESDVFLVAGSSLTVQPAASLPARAARTGATVILVNLDETPHDSRADYVFREDVTEVLPALEAAVMG
ncbi:MULTISPECIES: SIR2 family NAD-dependent protein deacylase [Halorussus]|uniref:SIR2 family NAD-dependent protein deacylase n=1 Tax=Halorussus TaxID=1070314 RepID=UPI0020A07938|nr:Sir2 family NAD-dependent protein deacetylase [Halorussus vallis]USZ74621.1 Sir2 family NAD-dependent protein deacetylase [Halorussus vallis]